MVLFQDAVINTGPVDSARELKHVPSFTTTINSLGVRVNTSEMLVQGSCHIGNSTFIIFGCPTKGFNEFGFPSCVVCI